MLGCGKRKKGIAAWTVTVVLLAFIGAFLVGAPQIVMGWANQLMGMQPNCNDDHYNGNCICGIGQRRISVPWFSVPRWSCETIENILVDPDSPTFTDDAIAFVKNKFEYYCGNTCEPIACGDLATCFQIDENTNTLVPNTKYPTPSHPQCIEAIYGHDSSGRRSVSVECKDTHEWYEGESCTTSADCQNSWYRCDPVDNKCYGRKAGTIRWSMRFLVESPTDIPQSYYYYDNFCKNEDNTEICTNQAFCDQQASTGGSRACVPSLPTEIIPQNPLSIITFGIVR